MSPRPAVLVLLATTLALPGCAKQERPPGAVEESQPPTITEQFPGRDTVLPVLDDAARVKFDEPISAGRNLRTQLQASPAYRYRVRAGHSDVTVEPEDGWRPGAVYVLELSARISDLLTNPREEPIRWRFSTGPPITATMVSGGIWDRVTGERHRDARAIFLPLEGDSIPYTAVADTGGRFRLEAVPPGGYRAFAFIDRNRNLTLDRRLEPADSATFSLEGPAARAELQFVLVEPDSTPPVLGLAEVRDSLTLRLTFDDHLLPGQELGGDEVTVRRAETGEDWAVEEVRVLEPAELAGRDTTVPGAARDTGEAAVDTVEAGPDTPAAGADTAVSPVGPLPTQRLLVRLAAPLVPDSYRVRARGVENLRRIAGGGDTLFVYERPEATEAAVDTAGAVLPDTTAASDTASRPGSAGRRNR